jgi:hypothetical protein
LNDREFAEGQEAIYTEMGAQLLAMIDVDHERNWREVLYRAERIMVDEAKAVGVHFGFRTTVVLEDGTALPLIVRPALVTATEKLDQLCRARSQQLWNVFDYRLYRDGEGPAFECRFSYPL